MFWPALLLAAAMAPGCSTVSEVTHKLNPFASTPKLKPAELPAIQAGENLQAQWQAMIGAAGTSVFVPAVVGDSVYAAAADGTIAKFEGGRQVWRISTGQALTAGVGADGKRLAVATAKGEVLVFDAATGEAIWKARVSSEVLAAPTLGDGLVVVRAGDTRIFGLDAADGKRRWVYQRSTPSLSLRSAVGVLLADRVVVAGFPGGKLVAINSQNGAALWEVTVALPKGSTELERIADLTSLPVVDGRQICAAAYQGRVACFNLTDGNMSWGRDVSSFAGLDLDTRRAYVTDEKGVIHAFDRETGAVLWTQDKLLRRGVSRPLTVDGDLLAVGDFQGYIHLLRRDDGTLVGRFATDGSAVNELRRLAHGFIVQTRKGGLFALNR